jgi:signal transduction histidine kinase/CheY-like chemotaxis protein
VLAGSGSIVGIFFAVVVLLAGADRVKAADVVHVIADGVFDGAGRSPTPVSLPDTWSLRGAPASGDGRYRLELRLPGVPSEPWAIHLSRISPRHLVRLNGTVIARDADALGHGPRLLPSRALIDIPENLLRAGSNELVVEVTYSEMGGLSRVAVGPLRLVGREHQIERTLTMSVPQAMNVAAFGVAVMMCLVWWRCRSLVAIGAFGGLAMIATARGVFSVIGMAGATGPASAWLTYVSHLWAAVLLGVFAQAFAERRYRWLTPALLIMASLLTAMATWAIPRGLGLEMRQWTFPIVIASTLPSLWLCLGRAREQPSRQLAWQAAGAIVFVAAGVHDYAMQTLGLLPITHTWWMPYALPPALVAVSVGLVDRIVVALLRIEGLNAELESLVAERTRALEGANAAKTRFLAAASHDLRQPLVSIGLMVEMAREQAGSSAQRKLLERANESVAAMESLLTGLLDLSRLDAGTVQVRRQAVRLTELWSAIEAHEAPFAAAKGLRLRLRPTAMTVDSDPVLLERVLRNLVSNAVRYTERGSVLVAARRRGEQVVIEVRDSGIGIAASDHERIFDEFVQLQPRTDRSSGGLGLGLAIVARTSELLAHDLSLVSAPGCGSTFRLRLDVAATPRSLDTGQPTVVEGAVPLAGSLIVVVEDDPAVRDALTARLAGWGARVTAFDDVAPAIAWLAGLVEAPDLLITDYQLPSGSGTELIECLRDRFGSVFPSVVITGDTRPVDLSHLAALSVPVVHKPFRSATLLAALREATAGGR